jgi:hypothetical protein
MQNFLGLTLKDGPCAASDCLHSTWAHWKFKAVFSHSFHALLELWRLRFACWIPSYGFYRHFRCFMLIHVRVLSSRPVAQWTPRHPPLFNNIFLHYPWQPTLQLFSRHWWAIISALICCWWEYIFIYLQFFSMSYTWTAYIPFVHTFNNLQLIVNIKACKCFIGNELAVCLYISWTDGERQKILGSTHVCSLPVCCSWRMINRGESKMLEALFIQHSPILQTSIHFLKNSN